MSQMVTPETVYPASRPRIRRPEFVLVLAVIALMLTAGLALVLWTSAQSTPATVVAPGPLAAPEVAAARAEAMVALGAARWQASPQNVASLRAAELAAHLEARWLASQQDGEPAPETAVPERWAQVPI